MSPLFLSTSFLSVVMAFDIVGLQFGNLDLPKSAIPLQLSNDLLLFVRSFVPACIMTTSGFFRISGFKGSHISSVVARDDFYLLV